MPRFFLGKLAVKAIEDAVSIVFAKIKARMFNRPAPHQIVIKSKTAIERHPEFSLPGIFLQASVEERNKPNLELMQSLERVAEGYLDAHQEATKSRVVHAVDAFLNNAKQKGIKTDVATVLGGQLSELFGKLKADVGKIVNTEATTVRNVSTLDGMTKVAAAHNIEDPTIYWVGPNDSVTCAECRRMYLLTDQKTPRVWLLSEAGHTYHKRGDFDPKIAGCHPNCRHTLCLLMPGYGFVGGSLQYISYGHDELKKQRS